MAIQEQEQAFEVMEVEASGDLRRAGTSEAGEALQACSRCALALFSNPCGVTLNEQQALAIAI
jgi:hypothetical protein